MAATRTFTVTTDPTLDDKWVDLETQIGATALIANRADGDVAEKARDRLTELKGRQGQLRGEIMTAARVITVTRLAPKAYARLLAEHPPRKDDPFDSQTGFNTDTFDRPLMDAAITTVTDGHGTPVEDFQWSDVADFMSFTQYQEVLMGTLALNLARDAVPFSLPASVIPRL